LPNLIVVNFTGFSIAQRCCLKQKKAHEVSARALVFLFIQNFDPAAKDTHKPFT
jgi:hypothetical protein